MRNVLPTLSLAVALFFAHFPLSANEPATPTNRPNVLFILSDDQRPDTIAALGNPIIHTPHLDRLVREGTTFTRAIAAVPICVASRAELITGRDGRLNGNNDFGFSPNRDAVGWGEAMRAAGYTTCYTGKWHTTRRPRHWGFEQVAGLFASGGGKFPLNEPVDWKGMEVTGYAGWIFQTEDPRAPLPDQGVGLTPDISTRFADAAIQFLRTPRAQPFFLSLNFTAPHDPLLMPSGYEKLYDPDKIPLPENFAPQHPFDHGNAHGRDEMLFSFPRTPEQTRHALAVYYAVISHMDAQIGRVLKALEQTGQLERTLIIFSSDHGLAIGSHGLRGKQNMYEHTIGVPLILRGPGIPRGETRTTDCYLRDLYPTVCELTGVPCPATVTAKSLAPTFKDPAAQPHDALFAHFQDSQRMIRTERWKLIQYPRANQEQLFDLKTDPLEQHNLINTPEHAEIRATLTTRLTTWQKTTPPPP